MRLIYLAFCVLTFGANSFPQAQEKKPNILFILTDDQRFDALGCAGHPIVKTPNLDRLAARGILFRNSFVTTPICAASRAKRTVSRPSTATISSTASAP